MFRPARATGVLILLAVLCKTPLSGEEPAARYVSTIDWAEGVISTRAEIELDGFDAPLTTVRRLAVLTTDSGLAAHLVSFLETIPVDSSTTIRDHLATNARLLPRLSSYVTAGTIARSYVSPDLSTLVVEYRHLIYPDLASLFITHARAFEHEPYLGFSPTTAFSGLVIYAAGEYPVIGEERTASLLPALRPRIFDESMRLLYDPGMGSPERMVAAGVVGYSESVRLADHRSRVGDVPLTTMARAVFGANRTDVVIPDEVAERILSDPRNRRLLAEGRVLIICDLP